MYADQRYKQTRRVPHRLEPFGLQGWTIQEFTSTERAAEWMLDNFAAKMPCWIRYQIVHGQLFVVGQ